MTQRVHSVHRSGLFDTVLIIRTGALIAVSVGIPGLTASYDDGGATLHLAMKAFGAPIRLIA